MTVLKDDRFYKCSSPEFGVRVGTYSVLVVVSQVWFPAASPENALGMLTAEGIHVRLHGAPKVRLLGARLRFIQGPRGEAT